MEHNNPCMRKNYNNARPKLHLPEYGRHIQKMVNTLLLIEDRTERNRQARAVIAVMGNLNPLLRDTPVFTHKLWDHLFIISDFQLDIDSPYDKPTRDELTITPRKLSYPQCRISHKHYGKYIARIVRSISDESPEHIASTVDDIAVYMRTKSYEYNQEHPNNEAIIKDIKAMSNGTIQIDENAINNIQSNYKLNSSQHAHKGHQRSGSRPQHKNRTQHAAHTTQHPTRNFTKSSTQRRNIAK